jgi:hypothetical protein
MPIREAEVSFRLETSLQAFTKEVHSHPIGISVKAQKKVVGMAL